MMEEGEIKDVFKHYHGFPVPVFASVTAEKCISFDSGVLSGTKSQNLTISAEWSQCEVARGIRLRYCQHWTLLHNQETMERVTSFGPCINTSGELLSTRSPSGARRAVLRETSNHGVGHQYLEVWGYSGLEKSFDLKALNKHGQVYVDVQFACLAWSPREERILYVAEKKRERPSGEEKDRNVYMEDWGEGLSGRSLPVLCVADLATGDVSVCSGVPAHVSPGQGLWAADGRGLIFVGWWHEPFRLGLKYCSNRRSALFYLDLKGCCELLSGDTGSVLSPRLSPDSLWLVYLQGQVFGPHHQCLRMILYDMKTRISSVLVDVVRRAEEGQFAGVYEPLPLHCWSSDSEKVFFSSACGNGKLVFSADRRTGRVTPMYEDNAEFGSVALLTVEEDLMVMSCSAPDHPPSLIHTPVLLMLGGKDKRVPPYQGLELYGALKSRNSPVRLLWFEDDGHSLSKVETQTDCFLNAALWFRQHLNIS